MSELKEILYSHLEQLELNNSFIKPQTESKLMQHLEDSDE